MRITITLLLFFGIFPTLIAQSSETAAEQSGSAVYKIVDQMPRFYDENCAEENTWEAKSCSQKAMLMYIYGNIKYPEEARENNVEGMAVISFIVDADGWIYDPKIVRNPGAGTGEEALRLVEKMMDEVQWWPGMKDGEPVDVQFNLPVKFKNN